MKKYICLILISLLVLTSVFTTTFADNSISVTIDGKAQAYDVMPLIENGRTLVPMRGIFEALGANINWDDATKTVTGTKDEISISLQIGNTNATVNGKSVTLDVPAMIIQDRTMVPVRFISEALGCEVQWEDNTKTVIINSPKKMAKLISTVHRPIPTVFEKTNDPEDLIFYETSSVELDNEYAKLDGKVVVSGDKFFGGMDGNNEYGSYEIVDDNEAEFGKKISFKCVKVPEKSAMLIYRLNGLFKDTYKAGDTLVLSFKMRCAEGGETSGISNMHVQLEEPVNFRKALFNTVSAGREWTSIYLPYTAFDGADNLGFRFALNVGTIEVKDIKLTNYGTSINVADLPVASVERTDLSKDASWRKDAIKNIEKIRKGDFTVVVKDKAGNVIPDANVEFDMFEHEFKFGSMISLATEEHANKLAENFNTVVHEHVLKWAPHEEYPQAAQQQIDAAKKAGIKHFRGHTLYVEVDVSTSGARMTPKDVFDNMGNLDYLLPRCESHVKDVIKEFNADITEWDVCNELVKNQKNHVQIREKLGNEFVKMMYDWAREAGGEDMDLTYNETSFDDTYFELIDDFVKLDVDFDSLGIQSHYDNVMPTISELSALYNKIGSRYNVPLKITEYSCNITDNVLQANYTRDIMINAFSNENITEFIMWGFQEGIGWSKHAPIYDTEFNLKPAGKIYQDLVYNKWWTKDAKVTTDAEGKATVRGFYGDYDITVNANGKTKTVMSAFHKGYDNVLEIVID
ncbi:MAG: hypothetical protein E7396_07595 [Ruminococcaceae bacterium]|nr:hypothetical protein [Oscillospiraceae bacterium]